MKTEKETLADYIFHGMDDTGLTSNDEELMKWLYGDDEGAGEFANQTVKFNKTAFPETSARSPNVRKLKQREIDILLPIFGAELEYSKIRIRFDSIYTIGNFSRGIGNYICVKDEDVDRNGVVSEDVLIHEAAHVWQYQKTMGVWYAPDAILHHIKAGLSGGSYDPYNYDHLEGKAPWSLWNPEAQADWIKDKKKLPTGDILHPEVNTLEFIPNGL